MRECWYRAYIFAYIQLYNVERERMRLSVREKKSEAHSIYTHRNIPRKTVVQNSQYVFLRSRSTHTAYALRTDTSTTHGRPLTNTLRCGWILWLCYFFSSFFHTPQPTRPCAVCATTGREERKREMLEEKKLGKKKAKKNSVRESTEHRRQADFSMSIRVS